MQPVLDHCRYKKNQYPGVPLFIIGNSLGGLVAVLATSKTQVTLHFHPYVLVSLINNSRDIYFVTKFHNLPKFDGGFWVNTNLQKTLLESVKISFAQSGEKFSF